jgi:hypothetical protein
MDPRRTRWQNRVLPPEERDAMRRPPNALTVDVEEYFQVEAVAHRVDRDEWDRLESRVAMQTDDASSTSSPARACGRPSSPWAGSRADTPRRSAASSPRATSWPATATATG